MNNSKLEIIRMLAVEIQDLGGDPPKMCSRAQAIVETVIQIQKEEAAGRPAPPDPKPSIDPFNRPRGVS